MLNPDNKVVVRVTAKVFLFVFTLVVCGFVVADQDPSYRLGTGDYISVNVFQEKDLTLDVRISDSGTISYPLLGEIRVAGLTVAQLEQSIVAGLLDGYLIDPRVSVSVTEYRQFFVNGEVKSPGAYSYVPGLTVRKAISIAGGFEERADENNLQVLRDGGIDQKMRVGIDDHLEPGDMLTVEQSFF